MNVLIVSNMFKSLRKGLQYLYNFTFSYITASVLPFLLRKNRTALADQ